MKQFFKNKRILLLLKSSCVIFWLSFLRKSEAFYAPYLLFGIAGIVCLLLDYQSDLRHRQKRDFCGKGIACLEHFIAIPFSLAVISANYSLFSDLDLSYMTGKTGRIVITAAVLWVCFLGGFFALFAILRYVRTNGIYRLSFFLYHGNGEELLQNSVSDPLSKEKTTAEKLQSGKVFFIVAAALTVIYSLIFFLAKYPGTLTEDSISQLEQLLSGTYSNHHPFYHTMLIKGCISLGLAVFGQMNAAVAVYSFLQIVLMACTFAYLVSTLYCMGLKKRFLAVCVFWFMFLPCHFMYSFSMWKDVPFAAALTIFLLTLYRELNQIGRRTVRNRILLFISGLGVCLLRSNGWAVFLASFLCFLLLFGKQQIKLCIFFLAVLVSSYVLKHPVLDALGVSKTDTIEALSIPTQQVARVLDERKDELTEEQRNLLNQIVDIDRVPIYYSEFISNPVKELVRETDNQEYLRTHSFEFLKLYFTLGFSHPKQYFEAYVEQTKGYWDASGYNYWVTTDMVAENSLGITKSIFSKAVNSLAEQYVYLFSSVEFLALFQSIGFHVWMMVLAGYAAICRRQKTAFFMIVPLVLNVLSLLIATPVFAEFRYTYSLFCVFPFILLCPFYKKEICTNG